MALRLNKILVLSFFSVLLISCKTKDTQKPISSAQNVEDASININKYLVQKDEEIIANFIDRQEWDMIKTPIGSWYMVYEHGKGIKVENDKIVSIFFTLSLLDGTICYESGDKPKRFVVGKGGVETGLREGILNLREGDKARFIIPPYLAHGLIGDNKKIPARSIILYDLTVHKVE